ncbi:MAG: phytoene/squalene synthase family protein [Reichenbachiella sp.]|uniref:phytoene/squalene synthase family protein n=1 Tax=Reichenbachiella sp. TaxID=2184521 RepID=UPI0032980063
MKLLFDQLSFEASKKVTATYSTSFYGAVRILSPTIQPAIHSIYGFVRFADEIVDSFQGYKQEDLLNNFEQDYLQALEEDISLNPIIHSFVQTLKRYDIDLKLVDAFLYSMRMDLTKKDYQSREEYEKYIYGSADVVGLMCLKIFVNGDQEEYERLKPFAMKLGSAFQKVNFLRDLKSDQEILERSYFPNVDLKNLSNEDKTQIIEEIEYDFEQAYKGIIELPVAAKFGVYVAYVFYKQLLCKLKKVPSNEILDKRVRVNDPTKLLLLAKSYLDIKFNFV